MSLPSRSDEEALAVMAALLGQGQILQLTAMTLLVTTILCAAIAPAAGVAVAFVLSEMG